jgi:ComF family protein
MFENHDNKKIKRIISRTGHSFLDLLFPPRCHICDRGMAVQRQSCICADCFSQLDFIKSPLCISCGCQFEIFTGAKDHYCGDCLQDMPSFDTARSLLKYRSPLPGLLHRLKYRADSSVIGAIEAILTHNPKIWEQGKCELIIPVPLHAERLRQRGFNQSQLLARLAFSGFQEKIAINLLVRAKNTTSQTGLSGLERRRNLKDAFFVTSTGMVEGRSVWLVDDVFTTGTTVSECSKILKKNGASEVHVWTLARA